MQGATRQVVFLVGLLAIIVLLSRLPEDVFATTQTIMLLAAACILLLLAGAVFLPPARRLLIKLFALPVAPREARGFELPTSDEWRALLRPLFSALVLLAAATLPVILRQV